ncbi:MAG: hypothetical protein HY884_03805 [Deltaproteobacteria bacterium]|nr:hypothetical protein [Deltaproteobacteria bacterium]
MATAMKRKENRIKVKQYITDTKGHKVAAVIEIEDFIRLKALIDIIPASEIWLYKNNEALESVRRGLKDAAKGKVSKFNIDKL